MVREIATTESRPDGVVMVSRPDGATTVSRGGGSTGTTGYRICRVAVSRIAAGRRYEIIPRRRRGRIGDPPHKCTVRPHWNERSVDAQSSRAVADRAKDEIRVARCDHRVLGRIHHPDFERIVNFGDGRKPRIGRRHPSPGNTSHRDAGCGFGRRVSGTAARRWCWRGPSGPCACRHTRDRDGQGKGEPDGCDQAHPDKASGPRE